MKRVIQMVSEGLDRAESIPIEAEEGFNSCTLVRVCHNCHRTILSAEPGESSSSMGSLKDHNDKKSSLQWHMSDSLGNKHVWRLLTEEQLDLFSASAHLNRN